VLTVFTETSSALAADLSVWPSAIRYATQLDSVENIDMYWVVGDEQP
jgi:hypothetical protein